MSGSYHRGRARRAVVALIAAFVLVVVAGSSAAGGSAEWNIARVGAPASSSDVLIAVVDTGVDGEHPAFGDRVLTQLDFTGDGERGDPQGHGTHVAGIAAGGVLDCGSGPSAVGVAPDASVLPVRVLDAEGSGRVSDVVAGIRAAADRGAAVINLSFGGDLSFLDGGGDAFRDAVEYAWRNGSIPVLAAGNSGLLGGLFGSGYGNLHAVVVTATTQADRKAGYASSVGSAAWGIAAPGGDGSGRPGRDVLSAYPDNGCAVLGGTSMAAPHVSGALAVLRSRGLSPQQAVDRLLSTARAIGPRSTYGAGLLDLGAAARGLDTVVSDTAASPQPAAPTSDVVTTTAPPRTTVTPAPTSEAPVDTPSTTGAPPPEPGETTSTTEDGEAVAPVDADQEGAEMALELEDDDGGGGPGAVPVALAVAGCAAGWVSTLRLRGVVRQP